MIFDLQSVHERLNSESLTQKQYGEYGKYNSDNIARRFGGWNNALQKAGISPSSNVQHTEQELYDNIERVWIAKGKQPVRSDMDSKEISLVSSGSYKRKFGSWNNALRCFVEYINQTGQESTSDSESSEIVVCDYNRNVNLRLRFLVMKRDNFKCQLCGASPATNPSVILHIDHIIPFSKGGKTKIDNLQTLCSSCNLGKSDMEI